jgi:methionyl-tRNA formyltransferase
MTSPLSILLLSKTNDTCRAAQRFLRARAADCVIAEGERTDAPPDVVASWSGDYLVSFLGPWVVPVNLLARARRAAINFHPGPPEYPGIGCYNFALYDEVTEYGVTCHEMAARVDSGPIVRTVRFPIRHDDSVASLKDRSLAHMLTLFEDVVDGLVAGGALPRSGEQWTRRPYTRTELNELCRLVPGMSQREIDRRVRATTFPGSPGAYFDLSDATPSR